MRLLRILSVFLVLCGLLIPVIARTQEPPKQEQPKQGKSSDQDKAFSRATAATSLFRELVEPPASIPLYIISLAKAVAVLSSRPQFGPFTGDEQAVGLVTARDPKTGKWAAPIFLTLKGGKIRDNPEYLPLEPILKARKTDIVLLAMDKRTADIFLKEEVVLGDDILCLPGTFGEIAKPGEPVYAVSTGLIAYVYNTGRILGVSISESSIKQDKNVNNAIYEEKRIDTFLPANKTMSPRLLSFTEILNQYYSAYAYR